MQPSPLSIGAKLKILLEIKFFRLINFKIAFILILKNFPLKIEGFDDYNLDNDLYHYLGIGNLCG